jgi:hypothetical protein
MITEPDLTHDHHHARRISGLTATIHDNIVRKIRGV